jgi:hypothetical protein
MMFTPKSRGRQVVHCFLPSLNGGFLQQVSIKSNEHGDYYQQKINVETCLIDYVKKDG